MILLLSVGMREGETPVLNRRKEQLSRKRRPKVARNGDGRCREPAHDGQAAENRNRLSLQKSVSEVPHSPMTDRELLTWIIHEIVARNTYLSENIKGAIGKSYKH
jgi:hypothetical protein